MQGKKEKIKLNVNGDKSLPITLGFMPNANSMVVDVSNGKILRIRPLHFDWKYDKKSLNPWTMKGRNGKSLYVGDKSLPGPYSLAYKKRIFSPNRVVYPLKRVDWNPEGERNPQTRGKSKFVRISWDEAGDIIAKEILRIKEKYTTYGILCQVDGHGEAKTIHGPHATQLTLLELLGGYTLQTRNPDSWEGWYWGAKHVWGMENVGQMMPDTNVMADISENSELLLFWGCDPESTPLGLDGQMASRMCYFWSEIGIKSIYICPDLNYGAAVHADKWIPILPNTDAAIRFAIAYIWITEDTYDKEYVATHTYGFDKFKDYVLGKEDGIPKTPAWASSKSAVPEWTIKALARDWAKKRTSITHGNGGPGIRGPFSTENGRLEPMLLGMQGLGKPGRHQVKMIEWGLFRKNPMPESIVRVSPYKAAKGSGVPGVRSTKAEDKTHYYGDHTRPGDIFPKQFIPKDLIHDALLNPPISWYGTTLANSPREDQFVKYTYPAEGCPEVHMIWTDSPCWITCWNDTNTYVKALRSPKIEFILAQHTWLENDCLFADIILPTNTKFEEDDFAVDMASGQYHILMHEKKCIEPVGESKSDYETSCFIADKLGLLREYTNGQSIEELIKSGFEKSGGQNLTTYEELKEKGYFVVPTDPEWRKHPVGMVEFLKDPGKSPLETPTGLLEFESTGLAKHFPDDKERPPVPHWIEKSESHDEALSSKRAEKYPLLVMSNHPRWRVHAQCDDISWTREAPTCKIKGLDGYLYEPLWIHPSTAKPRGIVAGDIVEIFNERGIVLCGAYVTERMIPGVVGIDHGARYDPIVPGEIDRGGDINTLTPHNITSKNSTGMVVSGFLVEVKKANVDEYRNKYPEAFKRAYDPAAGLRFDAWVLKE
jgi:anaerobic selenocysteine-containing dehydrogenase